MQIRTNIGNLENYKKYLKVLYATREYLNKKKYLEIDLPVLSPALVPESYLDIFKTELINGKNKENLYLIPSPELFLKRLIVQGLGSCYYLNKSFRNGDTGTSRHSPEFTILEFYKVGESYMQVAEEVLKMMRFISQKLFKKDSIIYQEKKISFSSLEKITVKQAFQEYANIDNVLDEEKFLKQAEEKGYRTKGFDYTEVWSQIYVQEVEPKLGTSGRPTIIYEYPVKLAATAKVDKKRNVAERLEIYIEGVELGNCGTSSVEHISLQELIKKNHEEQKLRKRTGKIAHKEDVEFPYVLKKLPPTSGIAIGMERLAMIFANMESIQDLKLVNIE